MISILYMKKWSIERLSNLSELTQLVNERHRKSGPGVQVLTPHTALSLNLQQKNRRERNAGGG